MTPSSLRRNSSTSCSSLIRAINKEEEPSGAFYDYEFNEAVYRYGVTKEPSQFPLSGWELAGITRKLLNFDCPPGFEPRYADPESEHRHPRLAPKPTENNNLLTKLIARKVGRRALKTLGCDKDR
jgi:hypothetical protein